MKAYISCPMTVVLGKVADVSKKLTEHGYTPSAWDRNEKYTDTDLKEADIFVLMSQHNQFDYVFVEMTMGCRKELTLAISLGKPLYMAYWKQGKELNIYPINLRHLEEGRVLGESGVYLKEADKVINNYSIY